MDVEAQALAEEQAAKDRGLLEALKAKRETSEQDVAATPMPELGSLVFRMPSRDERRAMKRRPHHKAYTQPKDAASRRRNRRRTARRSTAANRR